MSEAREFFKDVARETGMVIVHELIPLVTLISFVIMFVLYIDAAANYLR